MNKIYQNTGSPKLAAVSMIRNECDILELFIKINARVFDAFYILDHHSSDHTADIIKKLQDKGYPIIYKLLPDREFNQAEITTNEVRELANKNIFDYIFPIDGDEFLFCDSIYSPKVLLNSLLPKDRFGMIPWRTYCPISADYLNLAAPLYQNFRMRKNEPKQYYKVILGNEFAKTCLLTSGNHDVKNRKGTSEAIFLPLILQHIPIRSVDQLVRKVILGSNIRALRTNRKAGESYHYDLMAKRVREQNYQVCYDDLFDVAINYATSSEINIINQLVEDGPRVGTESDVIEFKNLASIELLKSFDMFALDLIKKVRNSPFHYIKCKISYFKQLVIKSLRSIAKKIYRVFF
jgi:hypothetical protein